MAVVSLSKPSRSHAWPSQMASIPYAAVDIAMAQPTFRASFLQMSLVVMILPIVLSRWRPRARRCLTCARQFIRQSKKKPSHLTGLALWSNFRLIPSQSSRHFLALAMDGPPDLSEAKNHATSVFSWSIRNSALRRVSLMLSSLTLGLTGGSRGRRPSYSFVQVERYLGFCLCLQEEMSLRKNDRVCNFVVVIIRSSRLTTDCGEERRLQLWAEGPLFKHNPPLSTRPCIS
jgi:hypothetical protein